MPVGTNLVLVALLLFLQLQELLAQDFLSIVTEKKYECESTVILRCAPSGCCGGSIIWRKDGTQIMAGGMSSISGKYRQTIVASSHFDFAIEDLNQTDLAASFTCVYTGTSSDGVTLNADDYYCSPCWNCAGQSFGYSLIGVILVIGLGFLLLRTPCFNCLRGKTLLITITSIVFSLLIDAILSVVSGSYNCWCEEGQAFSYIFVGMGVTFVVVLIMFHAFHAWQVCFPDKITGKIGSTVEMDFTTGRGGFEYRTPQTVGWTKLTIGGRIEIANNKLIIRDLKESDSGYYRFVCEHELCCCGQIKHLIVIRNSREDEQGSKAGSPDENMMLNPTPA